MGKVVAGLTCLACTLSLVSLVHAIGIEVGSQKEFWADLNGFWPLARITLAWLVWGALLLMPGMIAGWMACASRKSLVLAAVPLPLSIWILACINGFQLMIWQTVRASRPHGMSFNFELSLLGVFYFWPATLLCLAAWVWLRRRAVRAASANPALQGARDGSTRP